MSDPRDNEPTSPNDSGDGPVLNPFAKVLFGIMTLISIITWDATTKQLLVGTYLTGEGDLRSRDLNILNAAIGMILALAAGVGLGYHLGWDVGAPWYQYGTWGTVMAAAMAVYIWPVVYRLVLRQPFKFSEWLYSFVNLEATDRSRYLGDGKYSKGNPAWFSQFLMSIAWFTVAAISVCIAYQVACQVQANQAGWGWLGETMAVIVMIVAAIASIALIFGAKFVLGRIPAFLVLGVEIYLWYRFVTSGLLHGLFSNLSGGDWGTWGYVPGGVIGIVVGGIAGCAMGALLWNTRIRLVALTFGVIGTMFISGQSDALVAQIPLGGLPALSIFAYLPTAIAWFAKGVEVFLLTGIVFPLVHIAASHWLVRLKNIGELMGQVYDERRGGYREFFLQVVAIVGTGCVAYFAPTYVTAIAGWTSLWAVYGVTAALALAVYIFGYKILDGTGSWPVGLTAAGYAGLRSFEFYAAHDWPLGWFGPWVAAVAAVVATFVVLFPASYLIVRGLTQHWLAAWLRDGLVNFHKRLCNGIVRFVDEMFEAASKAYSDRTPYREVFAHVSNIGVAAIVCGGALYAGAFFGFAAWLSWTIAVSLTFLSYAIIGQALLRFGSQPIAFLTSCWIAVNAGIWIHNGQPVDWGMGRYVLDVVGGIISGAIAFGFVCPWVYLFLRMVINIFAPEKWLRPALMFVYDGVWKRFSSFWYNFKTQRQAFLKYYAEQKALFDKMYKGKKNDQDKGGRK